MNEELITINTAIIAKEKGFNEKCRDAFLDGASVNNVGCSAIDDLLTNKDLHKHINNNSYSRPTQSLLQKWLREKHNLIVEPQIYNTEKYKLYYAVGIVFTESLEKEFLGPNDKGINFQLGKMFTSYENALEAGLQEALKQIKQ